MELHELTLTQALEKLKDKSISSFDLTKAHLERIALLEKRINAYVTVNTENALQEAKKADKVRENGDDLPLLGIPFAIKDNFSTLGFRTTASSNVLEDYVPPFDSTVVKKLKDAGMVLLGKTNMDAWAHGSSTETSDFGSTKNPWNTERLPGGSSGGSAAAIAADEATATIGSETAGSIRQPASWCGVVGLKPTYGRVSRYGVIAMGSSLDCPGPITKTVEDAARIFNVIAGHDPLDATTSSKKAPDLLKSLKKDIKGMTIGISDDYLEGVDPEVVAAFEASLKVFEKLGANVKKIKLFHPKYAIAVYTIIQRSEVSSNLARYDGIRFGYGRERFGEEAKRRIMLGTYTLSAGYYDAYYKKAQEVRTIIIDDFQRAYKEVDVIVTPTSPSTALPLGASKNHPMFGEIADVLVEPSSIAGIPGINITAGYSKEGLPIGIQIMGPHFDEETIMPFAHAFERETQFYKQKPNL